MAAWLRQLLSAPEYPGDPEQTALGRLFHIVAIAIFAAFALSAVNNLLGGASIPPVLWATIACVAVLIAVARMGRLALASALLPPVILAGTVSLLITRNGVHDSAIVAIAGVLVVGAVLLGSRRWLAAFTAVAVAAVLAVGYAEMAGWLRNPFSGWVTVRYVVGICLTYVVIAVAVRVLAESLIAGLRDARQKSAELAASNLEGERRRAALETIMEAIPAATTLALEDGTLVEANRAALDLFGRGREEVIGQTALSLGLWPNPENRAKLLASLRAGEAVKLRPLSLRRKSGEVRDLLLSAKWVEFDRQKQLLMSAVDVSEIERAQESLRKSEERFAKVFQSSPDAIVISRLADGRYLEVNQRWLDIFGYAREELIGRSSLELGVWVDPADRDRFVARIREHGSLRDYEARFRKKSGAVIDVLLSAEVMEIEGEPHIIVPFTDITDRKRIGALLDNIARGVSSRTGEEFFREMLLFLCKELPADMAFVGELLPSGDRIRTIAACRDGELSEDFDYALAGSPCMGVLDRRGTAIYPERVAELFPEDTALAGRAVQGYVGTSLIGADGKAIGILVALTRKPIERREFFVSLLEIFASRAGAEVERSRAEERIRQLATRDGLTGLPNRLLLTDRLALGMGNAQRNGKSLAVLFIDLDRFKYINDSLGHVVGDAFLHAVAERLSAVVRKGDTLARLGGDEFVVLLENVDPMEDAAGQVARKILASFGEPFAIDGHSLSCSCSIGISVFPSDATDAQTLIRDADTAMYNVKEGGRGSYRYFSSEMNAQMQERLQTEVGLRDAISRRQFELAYQPKVGAADGRLTGLEALLRWRHPAWGLVSPGRFISVAEDSGLILEMGQWVLEEVCRQISEWRSHGLSVCPVAVNLSVRQFTPALIGSISGALSRFGVDPRLVEFEVTESLFMHNPAEVGEILKGLSGIGTRVTIDDFGTGYSSLSYIRDFAVDALKIDRSFVSDIAATPRNVAVVLAIITMAHGLGIRVIAEGVETREQLELLRKSQCDEYQGYLFSAPLAPQELERQFLKAA